MDKYVLITGASAGLGKAMAIQLAQQGNNLILVALPDEGLANVAEQLQRTCNVTVAYYEGDLCKRSTIDGLITWLYELKIALFYLINNVGIGGSRAFDEADVDYIERMLQLNVMNTALLTRGLLPFLLQFDQSYVLNVASMAAFSPMPYKTVYPASKAFIYSFSLGLRAELASKGVQVSVLHPGSMPHSPENKARLEKHGWIGRLSVVPLEDVAHCALRQVSKGKSVIIPGWANRVGYYFMKWIPWAWRKQIMTNTFRKEVADQPLVAQTSKQPQIV